MTKQEVKQVLGMVLTCQSLIHQIDEIQNQSTPVREFKRDTNRYLKSLEKFIDPVNKAMNFEESQYYINIVSKIDELINSIEVEGIE
jgi:hypothetical protein